LSGRDFRTARVEPGSIEPDSRRANPLGLFAYSEEGRAIRFKRLRLNPVEPRLSDCQGCQPQRTIFASPLSLLHCQRVHSAEDHQEVQLGLLATAIPRLAFEQAEPRNQVAQAVAANIEGDPCLSLLLLH
jgi:hypothetical protein